VILCAFSKYGEPIASTSNALDDLGPRAPHPGVAQRPAGWHCQHRRRSQTSYSLLRQALSWRSLDRYVTAFDPREEISARTLYQEAATHCHSVRDYVTRDLFEKLMHDEEEHIDFLETQLDLVAKLGLELDAQHPHQRA
jgi:Ferritin-like domain